jgi:hypothetical protein
MEKELTDLFNERRYHDLSLEEKEQLTDLCASEEEFEQMRQVFSAIQMSKNETFHPKKETKDSLDELFASVHAPQRKVFWMQTAWLLVYPEDKPFIRKPLVQFAAIGILLLLTVPFLLQDNLVDQKTYTSKVEKNQKSSVNVTTKSSAISDSINDSAPKNKVTNTAAQPIVSSVLTEQQAHVPEQSSDAIFYEVDRSSVPVPVSGFDHPDGEFNGVAAAFSFSVQEQIGVLDLITATF